MLGASYNQSTPSSPTTLCYFSLPPARTSVDSEETPLASPLEPFTLPETPSDPTHPLLALRSQSSRRHSKMDASSLLSLQTTAAYSSRPQPQPLQNDQHIVTDTPSNGSDASTSSMLAATPARCSRCHRSLSLGTSTDIVSFGTNLYYCSRCANLVGYTNR